MPDASSTPDQDNASLGGNISSSRSKVSTTAVADLGVQIEPGSDAACAADKKAPHDASCCCFKPAACMLLRGEYQRVYNSYARKFETDKKDNVCPMADAYRGYLKDLWSVLSIVNALLVSTSITPFSVPLDQAKLPECTRFGRNQLMHGYGGVWSVCIIFNCIALLVSTLLLGSAIAFPPTPAGMREFWDTWGCWTPVPVIFTCVGAAAMVVSLVFTSAINYCIDGLVVSAILVGLIFVVVGVYGCVAFCKCLIRQKAETGSGAAAAAGAASSNEQAAGGSAASNAGAETAGAAPLLQDAAAPAAAAAAAAAETAAKAAEAEAPKAEAALGGNLTPAAAAGDGPSLLVEDTTAAESASSPQQGDAVAVDIGSLTPTGFSSLAQHG